MRGFFVSIVMVSQIALMSSCATAWQGTTYADDLYSIHNKTAIAERQKAEAELAKAQYEAQQAQYEAAIAQIKAEAAKQGYTVTEGDLSAINGYDAVLADSYESAYARRLYGFSSPTYRMPSSYYTWRYSDAFQYASAYDPALYNIMVSGDMVWVEPKYITSMFGSWGAVVVPSYSWYYGWDSPYYYWNRPYRWSWYWDWHYPHHRHHYPHKPSYHRPPHNRPPHAGSGSVGSTGHHHNRPGMAVGRNPVASQPADRGGNVRPSQPSNGRTSAPSYRGGSSSNSKSQYSSGSSSYRSGSSSNSSTSYRSSGSSSSRGSSFSGGGTSHSSGGGSYSGGGNSRGR